MGKHKKNQIRVSFVGNNAEGVTGSCSHIRTDIYQILLECGLHQSCTTPLNDYKINSAPFKFKSRDINYVFVGHNHIDHIGLIPKLYAQGCKAKIIAPKGTYEIAKILLEDCAYIMSKDIETIKRKTGKDYLPIYTSDDVKTCLEYWTEYDFDEVFNLSDNGENIAFKFTHSGHILNSAQLELFLKQGNSTKKILYTSDLGNIAVAKYYVGKFNKVKNANLVIGESTYCSGDRDIKSNCREKDLEKIKSVIQQTCLEDNSKVLIPVFASDRCQNLLSHIYDLFHNDDNFKDIPVLVDSPMAVKICKAYLNLLEGEQLDKWQKVMSWNNLKLVTDYETSKWYQEQNTPLVCLSCSGMLVSGRSLNWTAKLLPSPKNHILFCGFSPQGSLSYKIKQGKYKSLKIDGKMIPNRCQIVDLKSFSSHLQKNDLLNYYSEIQCEKIALVHAEFDDKVKFAKELQEYISKKNNTSKVVVVNKSTEILL